MSQQAVLLDLHGTKATRGVDLDAFQSFLEHFRRALREYERARSASEPVGRTGRPTVRSELLTGFRLVRFREGSGQAALEPVEQYIGEATIGEPAPTRNLRALLRAVEDGLLPPLVADALDRARKGMGDDGVFGVVLRSQPGKRVEIDANTIRRLEGTGPSDSEPTMAELTVSGFLHLIEVYDPVHVAIRAADGTEWRCEYDAFLEGKVLSLVKSRVWATGIGRRTGLKSGVMILHEIQALPHFEPTPLWSDEPRSADELAIERGITGPQGLRALEDPEWEDDERERAFLALVLGADEGS